MSTNLRYFHFLGYFIVSPPPQEKTTLSLKKGSRMQVTLMTLEKAVPGPIPIGSEITVEALSTTSTIT